MSHPSAHRHDLDFYPTPPEATRALLSVLQLDGPIWEPACGDGAISQVLMLAGHNVVSTDLVDRGFGEPGVNFLTEVTHRARHIITNPPYGRGLADHFILKALSLARPIGGTVAMLLDLASLAHPARTPFWLHNPPTTVFVLDDLNFLPASQLRPSEAHLRFCWCVWQTQLPPSSTTLRWLHTAHFRTRLTEVPCRS